MALPTISFLADNLLQSIHTFCFFNGKRWEILDAIRANSLKIKAGLLSTGLKSCRRRLKKLFFKIVSYKTKTGLKQSYAGLEQSYAGLEQSYAGLKQSYAGLKQSYAGLKQSYAGLEQSYAGMKQSYAGMEQSYAGLE